MALNPFDLTGGPFLVLYLVLLVAALAAGIVIPRQLRPEGHRQTLADLDMLAVLSGGRARFVDAIVARLLARGALVMMGIGALGVKPGARGETAAESIVLALSSPIKWSTIATRLPDYAEPVERRLVAQGLWMNGEAAARVRFWQTLPLVLLLGFGAIKLIVGEARHKPVGLLTMLLLVTAIVAAIRWFRVDRRTAAGKHALEDALLRHQRLGIAPVRDEVALGVALFGTTVLAGSALGDFHRLRAAGGDGGSSGGDGGCSGGGGCGGGGCGGCGG